MRLLTLLCLLVSLSFVVAADWPWKKKTPPSSPTDDWQHWYTFNKCSDRKKSGYKTEGDCSGDTMSCLSTSWMHCDFDHCELVNGKWTNVCKNSRSGPQGGR